MTTFPTTILVGVDGAEPSFVALRTAIDLAAPSGSDVHVAHVKLTSATLRPTPMNPPHGERLREEGDELLERCARIAAERGAELAGSHLRAASRVDRELGELCSELGVGMVVIGAGRSARTARRLAGSLPVSLLIARG